MGGVASVGPGRLRGPWGAPEAAGRGEGEAARHEFYTQGSRPYIPFERPELGADAAATVVTVSAASPEAAGDAAGHGYGCDHREPFASLGLASQSHAEPEDRTDLVKRWVRARMG